VAVSGCHSTYKRLFVGRVTATDSHFESCLSPWQADGDILSNSDPLSYKQSVWDKPGIISVRDLVESSYSDPTTES